MAKLKKLLPCAVLLGFYRNETTRPTKAIYLYHMILDILKDAVALPHPVRHIVAFLRATPKANIHSPLSCMAQFQKSTFDFQIASTRQHDVEHDQK
jgi:hypothetical protein